MKHLRSFIRAYKVLGRVLPNCSDVADSLECGLTGLQSNDKLLRDENLTLTLKLKTVQECSCPGYAYQRRNTRVGQIDLNQCEAE